MFVKLTGTAGQPEGVSTDNCEGFRPNLGSALYNKNCKTIICHTSGKETQVTEPFDAVMKLMSASAA